MEAKLRNFNLKHQLYSTSAMKQSAFDFEIQTKNNQMFTWALAKLMWVRSFSRQNDIGEKKLWDPETLYFILFSMSPYYSKTAHAVQQLFQDLHVRKTYHPFSIYQIKASFNLLNLRKEHTQSKKQRVKITLWIWVSQTSVIILIKCFAIFLLRWCYNVFLQAESLDFNIQAEKFFPSSLLSDVWKPTSSIMLPHSSVPSDFECWNTIAQLQNGKYEV